MENVNIDIIKNYEISNKQILTCYEQLTRSYFCQYNDFVTFYFNLKQLQYEFFNIIIKTQDKAGINLYEYKVTDYHSVEEKEYFAFNTSVPNTYKINLNINNQEDKISFIEFMEKYFNLNDKVVYRDLQIFERFFDYELKTNTKSNYRMPKLKPLYENFSVSKLKLLMPLTDNEIANLFSSGLTAKTTIEKTTELIRALNNKESKKVERKFLDYDYDHLPLYQVEDFDNFKPTETNFYLHQTYVQYHEMKKENAILNTMLECLICKLSSDKKEQKQLLTESRKRAKLKIKETKL